LLLALAAAGGLLGTGAALDVSGWTRPQGLLVAADTAPPATADGKTAAPDQAGGSGQIPVADVMATRAATTPGDAGPPQSGPPAALPASASAGSSADTSAAGGPGGADQGPSASAASATRAPAAAAAPEAARLGQSYAAQVMDLVNEARRANGCDALRQNPAIAQAAADHSRDMAVAGYFGHDSPAGVTPWTRMQRDGYDAPGGENIARGYAEPKDVVAAWLSSPQHRSNILNCKFRSTGVGYYPTPVAGASRDDAGPYWTQDFGYS
jgi:uncharacterized protein YkwD